MAPPPPLPPKRPPPIPVHEMVTPPSLAKIAEQHMPEKIVEKFTHSARVFWTAVCLASAIGSGGFYAGAKFVQLQTEFRSQMANMATKKEVLEAIEGLAPKCRAQTIAWLKSDDVSVRFPNYHSRNRPYAGRIVDIRDDNEGDE